MSHSFLWHDYETFGTDPRRDRPAQFAAIRTTADLEPIGEPMEWICQPALDYVPDPQACLVTGITPQFAWENGIREADFAQALHEQFAQPKTIGVGYNSIRFDDEFSRFLFWRNLIDPYGREWQNGNGRWDLLDVVRLAYALRPDGLEWPISEQGIVSFKLEHLAAANGLKHIHAHDAVSDVQATIELAQLIKKNQPRLFEFALSLHNKHAVGRELGFPVSGENAKPFIHVSGMFGVDKGCLAIMWPLAQHPENRNEIIAWDLAQDPTQLVDLCAAQIRDRIFTKAQDLPLGVQRLPIKNIHLNRSPMVVGNLKVLSPAIQERWGISFVQMEKHAVAAQKLPDMSAIWQEVFARPEATGDGMQAQPDPEHDLYGGFIGGGDKKRLERLLQMPTENWDDFSACVEFDDARLNTLLFRYRARNYPHSLDSQEKSLWQQHCRAILLDGQAGTRTSAQVHQTIDELFETASDSDQSILSDVSDWVTALTPDA